MRTRDVFGYSFSAIKLRKLRAGLTILGVVIGIAAIVALLSITQGLQTTITGQLEQGLATDTLLVYPGGGGFGAGSGTSSGGSGSDGGIDFGGSTSSSFVLYVNYTDEINSLSEHIDSSFAMVQQSGYIMNSSGINRTVTIVGVDFAKYQNTYPTTFLAKNGAIPTSPADTDLVVGSRIGAFRNETVFVSVGDSVNLIWTNRSSLNFVNETFTAQVTGVLDRIGGFNIGGPSDSSIYIPIDQALEFFGTQQASMIIVKLKTTDSATIDSVSKQIIERFGNFGHGTAE